jgi:D-3-phosphoglycerate dehydrogenase
VNLPAVGREEYAAVRPVMELAERLGRFAMQYAEGGRNHLDIRTQGSFVDMPMKPIAMAAAKGALSPTMERDVSLLNALSRAGERGWTVEDGRSNASSGFTGLLQLTLSGAGGSTTVAGTVYDDGHLRLVEIDGVPIDAEPEGVMLCSRNHNVPGVVGQIGSLLGKAGVNIAGLRLGSIEGGEQALALITVDRPLEPATLDSIQSIPEIISLRMIEV